VGRIAARHPARARDRARRRVLRRLRAVGSRARAVRMRRQEDVMVTVGEVHSEVVVEGDGHEKGAAPPPEVNKEQLRDLVRELLEEMLERHLRTEEPR
jgi:hypothetical protein